MLKAALADVEEGALEQVNALYIADISGMPALVSRLFAVPAMRRRPYAMLLDRDGSKTQRLPDAPEKATVIFLEQAKITRVLHLETPAEVWGALGLAPEADEGS